MQAEVCASFIDELRKIAKERDRTFLLAPGVAALTGLLAGGLAFRKMRIPRLGRQVRELFGGAKIAPELVVGREYKPTALERILGGKEVKFVKTPTRKTIRTPGVYYHEGGIETKIPTRIQAAGKVTLEDPTVRRLEDKLYAHTVEGIGKQMPQGTKTVDTMLRESGINMRWFGKQRVEKKLDILGDVLKGKFVKPRAGWAGMRITSMGKGIPAYQDMGDNLKQYAQAIRAARAAKPLKKKAAVKPPRRLVREVREWLKAPSAKDITRRVRSYIVQEPLPVKGEYRVFTLGSEPIKVRSRWLKIPGVLPGGMPVTPHKKKELEDYIRKVMKEFHRKNPGVKAPLLAHDVAGVGPGKFRIVETQVGVPPMIRPDEIFRAIHGKETRPAAVLKAMSLGLGVGGAAFAGMRAVEKKDYLS